MDTRPGALADIPVRVLKARRSSAATPAEQDMYADELQARAVGMLAAIRSGTAPVAKTAEVEDESDPELDALIFKSVYAEGRYADEVARGASELTRLVLDRLRERQDAAARRGRP